MTDLTYGDFAYDENTRTLRGILLPFGEASRVSVSGAEPIMFSADAIDLPRDPAVVTLNRHHNRHDPIGRATLLEKREAGIYAEFRVADTDEGDAYLRDERGTLRKLSAEVAGIVRDGVRAVRSKLTGAGVVPEGAFASAALFALGDIADEPTPPADTAHVEMQLTTIPESITVVTDPPTGGAVTFTPEADPANDNPNESEALMGNLVPGGGVQTAPRPSLDGLFAALVRNDPDSLAPYREAGDLFALSTVQHSGPTTLTIGADVQETGYLGELWTRAPYNRRFVPLVQNAKLTNYTMRGWRWTSLPAVADYAGNTAEVPSNAIDTEPVDVTASRLAGGHRIDRRFRDFNDQEVIGSYLLNQTEDYKRKTDGKVVSAIVAAGTTTAPGTVPTGIAKGLAAIVDGALGVIATENAPSYALVDPALWRDILLTPKDDILAYLETGFGFEQGTGPGFTIRPASVGAGKVFVGAKEALTFYELGETPIRVEGVVPGNGAEDIAVFGYWATLANNAAAIRSVTVAA